MSKKSYLSILLIALVAFLIPIEHKYDKLFRFYSLTLIPKELFVSNAYEKKLYFYVSDLILLGLGIFALYKSSFKRFFLHPLWLIPLLALFSIILSPFNAYPVAYSRLLQLCTPIFLFSIIKASFQEQEEKKLLTKAVLLAIFAAGLFQTAVGITQYFHQDLIGLRLLGETNQKATFEMLDSSRWLFDRLFHIQRDSVTIMRAMGTLPHANVFGGFLFFSLMATYGLFMHFERRALLFALTIPFQVFAMALSFSRSAIIAWGLASFFFLLQTGRRKGLFDKKVKQLFTLITLSFLLSGSLLYGQYLQRGGLINQNSLSKDSDNVRKILTKTSTKVLQKVPFKGLGFSQFSERSASFFLSDERDAVKETAPHNIFLFLAVETGIFSALALFSFLIYLLLKTLSSPPQSESILFSSVVIGFCFIGFCDFYPILFQQGKLMFFMSISLLFLHIHQRGKSLFTFEKKESFKMFDKISSSYDRINRVVSLGMDMRWRKEMVKHLPSASNLQVLDLATGTADQAIALLKSKASIQSITGIDLSKEMMAIGKKKVPEMEFICADAENLPFDNSHFDVASFSFGIRNVTNPMKALQEIERVLKPKGKSLILEFSMPRFPIKPFYLLYLRHILPRIGGALSKDFGAYQYLNKTIEEFPSGKEFCSLMEKAGFSNVYEVKMNLGSVTLYVGEKR